MELNQQYDDELEMVRKSFLDPVSLKIVSINLSGVSGELKRDLASDFAKDYSTLEAYAQHFDISIDEAQTDAEKNMGTEDQQFISMIARAMLEAVHKENAGTDEMSWRQFVMAMKKSKNVQELVSKNPHWTTKATEYLGKAFAEAIVLGENQGKLPDVDDPKVQLITNSFIQSVRLIIGMKDEKK
jgi:hypothetical protein